MSDTKLDDDAKRRIAVGRLVAPPGSDLFCANCQQRQTVPRRLRSAESFCSYCDFPLFYGSGLRRDDCVRPAVTKRVARRAPGVRGYATSKPLECRVCGEPNHHPTEEEKSTATCHRDNVLLFEPTPSVIASADWQAPRIDDGPEVSEARRSWRQSMTSWWRRATAWLRKWWLPVVVVAAVIVALLVWQL